MALGRAEIVQLCDCSCAYMIGDATTAHHGGHIACSVDAAEAGAADDDTDEDEDKDDEDGGCKLRRMFYMLLLRRKRRLLNGLAM